MSFLQRRTTVDQAISVAELRLHTANAVAYCSVLSQPESATLDGYTAELQNAAQRQGTEREAVP